MRFGAVRKLTVKQIAEMRQKRGAGILIKMLMKEYELLKASVYRYLGTAEAED